MLLAMKFACFSFLITFFYLSDYILTGSIYSNRIDWTRVESKRREAEREKKRSNWLEKDSLATQNSNGFIRSNLWIKLIKFPKKIKRHFDFYLRVRLGRKEIYAKRGSDDQN